MSRSYEILRSLGYDCDVLPRVRSETPRTDNRSGRLGHATIPALQTIEEDSRKLQNVESFDWASITTVFRKDSRFSVLFAVSVLAAVAVATHFITPVYEPSARLEVDPPGAELFSMNGNGSTGSDLEYLETQAKNLKSDELAIAVIRKLSLERNSDIISKADPRAPPDSKPESQTNPPRLTSAESAALKVFQQRLKVERDTSSRIISVSFGSHDPQLAASVTNTVALLFIENNYKTRFNAIMQSSEWLGHQLDDLRAKMTESAKSLTDFQRENGIAEIDDNKSTFAEHMSELNHQLTQAQADRIQLEAFLNKPGGNPESIPQFEDNPVVQQLNQKFAEVLVDLAKDRVIYGPNHPNVRKLQQQANELQAQLNKQRKANWDELQTRYVAARAREQLMGREINKASEELNQMAKYKALQKEAQANAELYNSLYGRIKQAGITAASKSSNVRIVDSARVLDTPSRPRWSRNLAAGLLAGILGGVLIPFVRRELDSRIHTPEDVQRSIGISAVSVLPRIHAGTNGHLFSRRFTRLTPGALSTPRFLLERPDSSESEALQGLRIAIVHSREDSTPKVLLVVSPFPEDGKTTVAVNLAMALAQQGTTCLLDADLRRPAIASAFSVSPREGLAEVLSGSTPWQKALLIDPGVPNLRILPAVTGAKGPLPIIFSESAQELIRDLRQRFEFVVVDSPPLIPYADGRALARYADGLIFIVRSGSTTRKAVVRSLELLRQVNAAPILQIVLNAADATLLNAYYGYAGGTSRSAKRAAG